MQEKLLNTIVLSIAGPQADKLVAMLYEKKNVNEFLIAKKLKLTINQMRNILYKLADEGLVSFTRKKDKKKGGWYTYYWTLNLGKSLSKFKEKLEHEIENLRSQIATKKSATIFYCKNCGVEFTQENALTHDYTCPECGEPLEIKDTAGEVGALEKEIAKREQVLNDVRRELGEAMKKEEKVRIRKVNAEAKKKKVEREGRRKKVAREKAVVAAKEARAKAARAAKRKKKKRR